MTKTYHIHWFGLLAERRGITEETLHCDANTPEQVYQHFLATHQLGLLTQHLRAAVNDELVAWSHTLQGGERIAFLPPMSGG